MEELPGRCPFLVWTGTVLSVQSYNRYCVLHAEKPVKALSYSEVEHSERDVAQNVGLSLASEQELDTRDQSVSVPAALRRSCYALSTSECNNAFNGRTEAPAKFFGRV